MHGGASQNCGFFAAPTRLVERGRAWQIGDRQVDEDEFGHCKVLPIDFLDQRTI